MKMQETSLEAYKSIDLQQREYDVLIAISEIQPCSNQDIAKHLDWPINRVTGRTNSLVNEHKIVDFHDKVINENNRTVMRWKLKTIKLEE